jgi:hypothetical protein
LNATECTRHQGDGSLDQKWLNLAPCYFEGTHIFRHPGYNVAHFNIDERAGILSNGELRMYHYTMLHQFQWNVASYAETLRLKENPALMRALNRYVDLVQAKQRELETRFGIMMVQPGSADEADTPLQVRESYPRMFPSPRPIASREECNEIRRQLAAG